MIRCEDAWTAPGRQPAWLRLKADATATASMCRGRSPKPGGPGALVKIATWNVNGIRARQAQLQEFIEREQPDVALPAGDQGVARSAAGLAVRHRGLLVLLARRQGLFGRRPARAQGRVSRAARVPPSRVRLRAPHRDRARCREATVASIYVPNGGKDFPAKMRFLEALDAYAANLQASGRPLIMCGDLNVARTEMDVHPKERKPRAIGQLPEERALIERIIGRGLVDVHRTLEPDNAELFTWWAPWRNMKQRNIGWRLDYVLASAAVAQPRRSCVVQREVGTSDHGPVVAVFDI